MGGLYGLLDVARTSWSDKFLGVLASLPGLLAAQGMLLLTCMAMLVLSEQSWEPTLRNDALAQTSALREGYILLSEIEQLVLMTIAAERRDRILEAHVIAVDRTAWNIKERIEAFQHMETHLPSSARQTAVVRSLKHLLAIIREIQGQEFTGLGEFTNDLVAASRTANIHVLRPLRHARRSSPRRPPKRNVGLTGDRVVGAP